MSEWNHGHDRDPQQDRDQGRDRDVRRSGHRREVDARQPRRSLSDRIEGVVRDVGTFRVVALADLVTRQFDGYPFAARQGMYVVSLVWTTAAILEERLSAVEPLPAASIDSRASVVPASSV